MTMIDCTVCGGEGGRYVADTSSQKPRRPLNADKPLLTTYEVTKRWVTCTGCGGNGKQIIGDFRRD